VVRALLFGALLWGVAIYAWRRGGRDEKTVAVILILATYLSPPVVASLRRFHEVEIALAMVDIALGAALLYVALRSKKFWPLWLVAMHGLTILSHFAPYVPHMIPWNYRNAVVMWSYPMQIVLGFAVYYHHRGQTAFTAFYR
jgi:signal transduction histidine kinase